MLDHKPAAALWHWTSFGPAPHTRPTPQANEFEDVNDRPEMAVSAMPVSLSMDVARLGRVACHSLHRRFLVLRNDSPTDTYSYIWNTTLPYGPAEIKVEPAKGSLAPGEHQVCGVLRSAQGGRGRGAGRCAERRRQT